MLHRRSTATFVAVLLPLAAALTSCGFDYPTDRVNTIAAGTNNREADVDVLGARVVAFARGGGPVLGICNGFQILTEAGLLPGALMRNDRITFVCREQRLRVDGAPTPYTAELPRVVRFPIAHGEGNYVADAVTLDRLEGEGRVVFRYVDDRGEPGPGANPNGSARAIAGIASENGRVLGLMPHPDRAMSRLSGSEDGRGVFRGLLRAAA